MRVNFDVYDFDGNRIELAFVTGEDVQDCEDQINAYLDTLQDCYYDITDEIYYETNNEDIDDED